MFFNKESITNNIMTSFVSSKTLTYKSRHSLRMKQTKPSILPNDLIMRIIREADGGLYKHQDNLFTCLAQILVASKVARAMPPARFVGGEALNLLLCLDKNDWMTDGSQSVLWVCESSDDDIDTDEEFPEDY